MAEGGLRGVDGRACLGGVSHGGEPRGPGPGPSYLDDVSGHEWSAKTGRAMAANLAAAARALAANPIPAPPG